MKYPQFIQKGQTIGITALSAGVGTKLDSYQESLQVLINQGYQVAETPSVRVDGLISNTAMNRGAEFNDLIVDDNITMIMCAAGGDVQFETLPYINYEAIAKHPKWLMGASDPTNLLFPVTTGLDIATLYGFNAGGYSLADNLPQQNNLDILSGNLITQTNYERYQTFLDTIMENPTFHDVAYQGNPLHVKGRCIGGCLDCIAKLIGTPYDHVSDFIERYKEDGIVWYLDNFAMSAYNTYLTLLQFKYAGYFKYTKAILLGRVAFESNQDSQLITEYQQAYKLALPDIPFISEMDIGHTYPAFTMINGAIIDVSFDGKNTSINFELK